MEDNEEKIRIERILGISVTSNAHFAVDSGILAYPAGSTVVLLEIATGNLLSHVVLENRKPISSLQLKNDSLLFVASEDSAYLRIIDYQSGLIKDISPCQNVVCCAVSSQHGILVTVGSDRVVSVWDYKGLISNQSQREGSSSGGGGGNKARKLASSSVACKVSCVTFSPDGNFFVTGGTRHLKFWYLQFGKNECVITGRPAILGSEHSNANFSDVSTDGVNTYAIANFEGASSTLCQFDERRFLDKWVQLKTAQAFALTMDGEFVFIGCAEGIIRCFRLGKLDFVATLPLPHHLGVDVAKALDVSALSSHPPVSKFPNVVAIGAPGKDKIVAVYADHSLYCWDVSDIKRVGLSCSWLFHSGCIWDCALGLSKSKSTGGGGSEDSYYSWPIFVTCSNDDTVRTWDITSQQKTKNLYSNECLDIKYISTRYLDSPLFISHGNGVRCVGIGTSFVCCGDRQGNLRLSRDSSKNELIKIKAHKEEVLAMDVRGSLIATASRDGSVNVYNIGKEIEKLASLQEHTGSVTSVKFLMTEKLDVNQLQIISCGADKNLIIRKIVPKKSEFSNGGGFFLEGELTEEIEIHVMSVITCKTPLFDLDTDTSGKHVLVACQDACIRVFNSSTGKQSKTLRSLPPSSSSKESPGGGTIIKITLDPSGYYVAASSTDKTITIFDYYKGEVVGTLMGHSELATAIRFTPDFQSLITVGGDSCIIVWSLPRDMGIIMETRMSEKRSRLASRIQNAPPSPITPVPSPIPQTVLQALQVESEPKVNIKEAVAPKPFSPLPSNTPTSSPIPPSPSPSPVRSEYKFNIGQLPDWARKQIKGDNSGIGNPPIAKKPSAVSLPQGKWGEKVESGTPMTIKSFYNSDTVVPVPFAKPQEASQKEHLIQIKRENSFAKVQEASTEEKESSTRDNSFEGRDESFKENEGDDEGCSTDFYSDVNKSTDGELELPYRSRLLRSDRDTDDTDESSSTRGGGGSVSPRKGILKKPSDSYNIIRSRNAELIMSVKAKNKEISRSRLELEKRLDDTRKKLQSIGYKSMSQSTQDLSSRSLTKKEFLDESDEEIGSKAKENGIRRACSLSDLNDLNNLPPPATPPTSGRRKRSFHKHRNEKSRNKDPAGFDPQNILTRSTSVSALMTQFQHSDSEPESLPVTPSYMSQTKSSQGKTRKKPSNVSCWSQSSENLMDGHEGRLRVSASEQNLTKIGGGSNLKPTPMPRSKMNTPHMKKPQQIHSTAKGMAVVQGVRQGDFEEPPLSTSLAHASVDLLRKSLDNVISLRSRVKAEDVVDSAPISRILDDGLRSVHRSIQESVRSLDTRPKIITEHEPTVL